MMDMGKPSLAKILGRSRNEGLLEACVRKN
jgi:hypothetical protein